MIMKERKLGKMLLRKIINPEYYYQFIVIDIYILQNFIGVELKRKKKD